jgi:ligand-binding sensor domain-containing protein/AraC-like DNA-binding protein
MDSNPKSINTAQFILLLLLLSGVSVQVYSQAPKLSFKHLNTEQGLSDNGVKTIFQDKLGYVWFGTFNGLNRYDGYKITSFRNKPGDSTSLSNNWISTLVQDKRGNLWVGTSQGLNRYNAAVNLFERYNLSKNGIPDNTDISSIYSDKGGNLWVATPGALYLYNYLSNRFKEVQNNKKTNQSYIAMLFEDSKGRFFILRHKGLYIFNTKTFTSKPFLLKNKKILNDSTYHSMVEDKQGNLWIGSYQFGVTKINISKNLSKVYTARNSSSHGISNQNACLLIDNNNNLWLGENNGGLHLYNRATDTFYSYQHDSEEPNSLSGRTVFALYSDVQGNLWAGTNAGVDLYSPNKKPFNYYKAGKTTKNLSFKDIRAIAEDNNGNIIIGTDGGGLNIMNVADRTINVLKKNPDDKRSLSSNLVISLLKDRSGAIWVGTWEGGLNLFDPKTSTFSRFIQENTDDNYITAIYEDRHQNLWTAIYNKGLSLFDRKHKTFNKIDSRKTNFKGATTESFAEDSAGNLWIGSDQALNNYDHRTGKFSNYYIKKDNINQPISAIFCDKKGRIWVGSAGLHLFDPVKKVFTHYAENSALKNTVVTAILEDVKGNLWIGADNGLYRFNPQTRETIRFDKSEGIQGLQFRHAALNASTGEFYFGGSNGLNSFFPSRIKINQHIPPVYITDFQVFNKTVLPGKNAILKHPIQETKEITLSYKESVFSFEFSAINFIHTEKNQYAYKMEGYDKSWTYAGNKRTATYTSLDPGEYVFRVKAANSDGIWNEKGTAIKIIITPPYWATWWFKTFVTLTVMLTAFVVYRYQIRHQQETKTLTPVIPQQINPAPEEEPKVRYRNSNFTSEDIVAYKDQIEKYMRESKPYLNDDLTLATLAKQFGLNAFHLSQVLNEGFGESFYRFINRYRIEESKALLLDPHFKNYTIQAIATEAGFRSKTSFNTTFKEHTGYSPSEYVKNHLS